MSTPTVHKGRGGRPLPCRRERPRQRDGVRLGALIILVGILVVAGVLRFTGLNWGERQYIHPDEGHMRNTLSVIRWPKDLSIYFDTHESPLNVRNNGDRRYSYGTLPLFIVRAAGEWVDRACTPQTAPISRILARALVGSEAQLCTPGAFTGVYSAAVGRALSALSDLGTLIVIYLIGRRLYGEAAGLLGAALGAFTAFLIQQAHFFTVDSMACLAVTLVALFSVRAADAGEAGSGPRARSDPVRVRWVDFALAGIGVGLAAACKVSAATAALLVVLAAVQVTVRLLHHGSRAGVEPKPTGPSIPRLWRVLLALSLAGLLSLIAFRVAQPYAFEGPGFFGVRPSPEWFGRLRQIRTEQSGEVDLPSGRQWANRAPILFPWLNIVVWGMGVPLGVAAWVGWGVAGFELLTGSRRGRRHLVLWGWSTVIFLYHATRWVKTMRYFLALYPFLLLFAAFWLVRLVHGPSRPTGEPSSRLPWRHWAGLGLSAILVLGSVFWGLAFFSIYLRPHTRVAASRWIFEHVPAGAAVANEHWDWGLPLRIDGQDPFGGFYTGYEMQNYDEDTIRKRQQLYRWLDEANWIFLASNRLYASIPRMPARYPLTTEYYRALFAGELGFELRAEFTSYPALGPLVFPDQENPFTLMKPDFQSQRQSLQVRLPPAEEAFSVYDHPRVLIFRKTETYSRERIEGVLGQVDLQRVQQGRTPLEATRAPDLLRFDDDTWDDQRAGGTWAEMFNREGLLNRYPGLAAMAWWLCVTALGWLAFPVLFASLPALRDRGYGFARLLALLIISYLTWLAASIRLYPNTRSTVARMVALLAVGGLGVGWLRRHELKNFFRERWRAVASIEALFAALFAMWIGVRLLQPDLWHPVVGGEKPMDFAYLNAVMKSTWFPPYNPWLAGTWINYYYFGFVLVGTVIKLMGTVPSIAYNLAVPLIFALTGVGAFSVAYNWVWRDHGPRSHRRSLLAGIAATASTVLVGNLGVVHLLRDKLIAVGDISFPSTIPALPRAVSFVRGLWRVVVSGTVLAMRPETWYWHPTRIIPAESGNPIAEFPAFTFLYGDLHAHMIAFPVTLFALALALSWARASRPRWGSLLMGGLVIGALRPTNTWDYPTYLLLGVVALGLGAWRPPACAQAGGDEHSLSRRSQFLAAHWAGFIRRVAWRIPVFVGLTVLLYFPYIRHYVSGYNAVRLWDGEPTPAHIYLWVFGVLLFPTVTRLIATLLSRLSRGRIHVPAAAILSGALLLVGAGLWTLGGPVALIATPILGLAALVFFLPELASADAERLEAHALERRSERLLWIVILGALGLSVAVEIFVLEGDIGRMNTVFKFYLQAWMLLSIAAAVSLAWIWERARGWASMGQTLWWGAMAVLALGGALFLPFGVRARAVDRIAPETGLTLDGMAFARDAVIHDGPEGDLREIPLAGDYQAILWMQNHIEGSPVILEGLGRREYLWANRVSIYTGLPSVVGWRWHQVQQRAGVGGEVVNWRREDVNHCYETTSLAEAEEILQRYGVRYIVVGAYERAYYGAAGLDKFEQMVVRGHLDVAYRGAGVTIYEVVG